MTEYHKIWIEQCEAAEQIEGEFELQKALDYLIGEKFLNFLEAAERDSDFRAEIPAFVAKIKAIFERWRLLLLEGGPRLFAEAERTFGRVGLSEPSAGRTSWMIPANLLT